MNSDAQNYIAAIGDLAEAITLFYKQLKDVVAKAAVAFASTSLTTHQKEDQNDGKEIPAEDKEAQNDAQT